MITEINNRMYDSVSLEETKTFLREDRDIEDPLIESLIKTAEKVITDYTGYFISKTEFSLYLEQFEDFKVPCRPLDDESLVVSYTSVDGSEMTLLEEQYDADFGTVTFNNELPELDEAEKHPVKVDFTCGKAPSEVEEDLKTAIKLLVLIFHRRELPEDKRENINPLDIKVLRQLIIDKKTSHFK